MARENESWNQEREEICMRLELNEARTKRTEDLLAAIALKLGVNQSEGTSENGEEFDTNVLSILLGDKEFMVIFTVYKPPQIVIVAILLALEQGYSTELSRYRYHSQNDYLSLFWEQPELSSGLDHPTPEILNLDIAFS
ncbi:hypothetical protein Lal_00001108 [Lupinus albus]|nr:hypothetical protein Lal_00001108 [Lupinus albus]